MQPNRNSWLIATVSKDMGNGVVIGDGFFGATIDRVFISAPTDGDAYGISAENGRQIETDALVRCGFRRYVQAARWRRQVKARLELRCKGK